MIGIHSLKYVVFSSQRQTSAVTMPKFNHRIVKIVLLNLGIHAKIHSERLKDPSQPPPFSMPSKLLILHGEAKSYSFTVSCVPESMFRYL